MVPFRLWNNDSLPAQFCIDSLTGGKPTQNMDKDSHGTTLHDMELKSTEGKGTPLFLGRKKDRNKEQHCGEQHNSRTGGDIPVRGDEYSPD